MTTLSVNTCPRRLRSVAVFTGAKTGASPHYLTLAKDLGRALADENITLVYGAGALGLMGAVADQALAHGGQAIGVVPQHLVDEELPRTDLTRLEIVDTMHQRKQRMAELADGYIALPGGTGTLDELFDVWTWRKHGLHDKPICLLDAAFWTPLLTMLDHMTSEGFIRPADREGLMVHDDPIHALTAMNTPTTH